MSQKLGSSLRRKVSETETQLMALHEAKLAAISGNAMLTAQLAPHLLQTHFPSCNYAVSRCKSAAWWKSLHSCGELLQVMTSAAPRSWRLRWRRCTRSETGWRPCPKGCTASAWGAARSWPWWRNNGSSWGKSWSRRRLGTVSRWGHPGMAWTQPQTFHHNIHLKSAHKCAHYSAFTVMSLVTRWWLPGNHQSWHKVGQLSCYLCVISLLCKSKHAHCCCVKQHN